MQKTNLFKYYQKWECKKILRNIQRKNRRSKKGKQFQILTISITYINRLLIKSRLISIDLQKSSNKWDTDQSWLVKGYDSGLTEENIWPSDTGRSEELEPRPPVPANRRQCMINARPNSDRVPKSTNRSERGPLTNHR